MRLPWYHRFIHLEFVTSSIGAILPLDRRCIGTISVGATGPQILNRLFGWSPAISDRRLSGSGSSQSVSKLSLILLLTLSIVTLAVQGHTGTLVDERTTNAQNGADLKLQFDTALTEEEARSRINASIELIDDNDIQGISSLTSVGTTFTETKKVPHYW